MSLCLSWALSSHFLVFPMYTVVFQCPVFDVWLPKGEKNEKWREGRKSTGPLNHLTISSARGEGLETVGRGSAMATCLFVCISLIRSSNQWSEYWSLLFGKRVLLPIPVQTSCEEAALRSCAQLPATWLGWGIGSCYCAKSSNWPKLTSKHQ